MSKSLLTTLMNYHYAAQARLWAQIESLSDADFRHKGVNGSIHEQLVSMMAAENLWINFLWHGEVEFLTPNQFPTRAAIHAEWTALEEEMRDFVDWLGDDELQREVVPPFWVLQTRLKVWESLVHIFNDAADSRARLMAQVGARNFCVHRIPAPVVMQKWSPVVD